MRRPAPMLLALLPALALLAAPWLYGAVEPRTFGVVALLTLGGAALLLARPATWTEPNGGWDWRWVGPWLALLVFVAVQAVNPSHVVSALDQGLTPRPHWPWLPSSVDRSASGWALLRLVTYGAMFWLVRVVARDDRARRTLLYVLVAGGTAMAGLTLFQRAGPKHFAVYPLTGRFVSENNYAAYANLLIPVALGLARSVQARAAERAALSHPGYLLFLAAGLMMAAVLTSGSLTGIAISALLLLAWTAGELRRGRVALKSLLGAALALAVVGGVIADGLGPRPLSWTAAPGQLRSWRVHVRERVAVCHATLRMARDRWLFGTGAGTFALVFPYYQPAQVKGYYRYPHQDFLQSFAELGVVGFGLIVAAGVAVLRGARRAPPGPPNARAGGPPSHTRAAVWLALAGVGLHAMVDFPLHIPAIAILAAAWLALATRPATRAH